MQFVPFRLNLEVFKMGFKWGMSQACNVPWSSDSEVQRSDVYFRGPVLVIGSHHQIEVETSTYKK